MESLHDTQGLCGGFRPASTNPTMRRLRVARHSGPLYWIEGHKRQDVPVSRKPLTRLYCPGPIGGNSHAPSQSSQQAFEQVDLVNLLFPSPLGMQPIKKPKMEVLGQCGGVQEAHVYQHELENISLHIPFVSLLILPNQV